MQPELRGHIGDTESVTVRRADGGQGGSASGYQSGRLVIMACLNLILWSLCRLGQPSYAERYPISNPASRSRSHSSAHLRLPTTCHNPSYKCRARAEVKAWPTSCSAQASNKKGRPKHPKDGGGLIRCAEVRRLGLGATSSPELDGADSNRSSKYSASILGIHITLRMRDAAPCLSGLRPMPHKEGQGERFSFLVLTGSAMAASRARDVRRAA